LHDKHPNKAEKYEGLDPLSTVIINCDKKSLPFPYKGKWEKGKNLFYTSTASDINTLLQKINAGTNIKRVVIDTVNSLMVDYEMINIKVPGYNKWTDLALQVYELITTCNEALREDLVVYLIAHATLYTDIDGNESKCIVTNGKKLEKIRLESKLPIVLYASVERTGNSDEYYFETVANRSTAKSPLGIFEDDKIPNSLALVDAKIREYYEIPV
jgi:hypothetical protein